MARFSILPTTPHEPAGVALNNNFVAFDAALDNIEAGSAAIATYAQAVSTAANAVATELGNISAASSATQSAISNISASLSSTNAGANALNEMATSIGDRIAAGENALNNIPSYRLPVDLIVYQDSGQYIVADGVTGNTTAYSTAQAALDAAVKSILNNSGSLYIRGGTYEVSGALGNGCDWFGGRALIYGDNDTVIKVSDPNNSIFYLGYWLWDIEFRNITLDGNYTGTGNHNTALVYWFSSFNIRFVNVKFRNAKGHGVQFISSAYTTKTSDLVFSGCVFEHISRSPISVAEHTRLLVTNCQFYNCCKNPAVGGTAVHGDVFADVSSYIACFANRHRIGAVHKIPENYNVAAVHTRASMSLVIYGCISEDHQSQGFLPSQTPFSTLYGNIITKGADANGKYHGYAGVYIESSRGATLVGNIVSGCVTPVILSSETLKNWEGVDAPHPSDSAIVFGNIFDDNQGAFVSAGRRTIIGDNLFYDCGYYPGVAGTVTEVTETTFTVMLPAIPGEPDTHCAYGYYQYGDIVDTYWKAGGTPYHYRGATVQACSAPGNGPRPSYVVLNRNGTGTVPGVNTNVEISNRQRAAAVAIFQGCTLFHHNRVYFRWLAGEEPYFTCLHITNKLNIGNYGRYIKYADNDFIRGEGESQVFVLNGVEYGAGSNNIFVNNRPNTIS